MDLLHLLVDNQILALVTIMAIGLVIGRIKIGNFRLGVAAVLFVGLAFATVEPQITLPPLLYILGLSLFVYTIGLEAAPGFFQSIKTTGLRLNVFALIMILVITFVSFGLIKLWGIAQPQGVGLFTGAMTNTPAMAAVVDALPSFLPDADKATLEMPVVAYSLTYPIGVLGVILSVAILSKIFKIDHDKEAEDAGVALQKLETHRIKVTKENLPSVTSMPFRFNLEIIVSRIEHNGKLFLPEPHDTVEPGDIISVVGTAEEVDKAAKLIGEPLPGDHPVHDENLDFRRIFVSSSSIAGKSIRQLQPRLQGVLITRVRRGDMDFVARPDTVLQLGDRVRVVADHEHIDIATKLFGDSYKGISDFNLLPLLIGMTLGLLVGLIEIPLPGGASLKLGSAGGPLLAALILGAVGRTGPFVWQVPFGANLALRQLGITIFLAGIGTTAGAGFAKALQDPTSLTVIGIGAVVTVLFSLMTLIIGYKILKIPFGQVAGMIAGMQTHPAVLTYVSDHTKNELPANGYTTVYPMSMVAKILCAQLLLFLLFL